MDGIGSPRIELNGKRIVKYEGELQSKREGKLSPSTGAKEERGTRKERREEEQVSFASFAIIGKTLCISTSQILA